MSERTRQCLNGVCDPGPEQNYLSHTKNLLFFIICLAIPGIIFVLILFITGLAPLHPALSPVPLNTDPTLVDGQIT